MRCFALPAFALEPGGEPSPFVIGKPMRVGRPIGEVEISDESEHHRRRRFDDEQPLPAIQSADAVHAEDHAGDRRADG